MREFRSSHLVAALGTALALTCTILGAPEAVAQSGIKGGVLGKITIDRKLRESKVWAVSEEERTRLTSPARVRRPSPYPVRTKWTEPVAALKVVLNGVKVKDAPPSQIAFDGLRFVPSHVLVARPGVLRVENRQPTAITVLVGDVKHGPIAPGGKIEIPVAAGESTLSTVEFPFSKAFVRTLASAMVLPIEEDGTLKPVSVEAGDYSLEFYYGARKLYGQPLSVPDDGFQAIVASVSENLVVAVAIKDGGLQVAVPVRRGPPPGPNTP